MVCGLTLVNRCVSKATDLSTERQDFLIAIAKPSRMTVLAKWKLLRKIPGGRRIFSWLLGQMAPYAGSIGAQIEELAPGSVRARMPDRRSLRNHLGSIHACALANLGEMSLGLAMTALQPPNGRWIPVKLEVEYLKKARGTLLASVEIESRNWEEDGVWRLPCEIHDEVGDVVTRVWVEFKIGYRPAGR